MQAINFRPQKGANVEYLKNQQVIFLSSLSTARTKCKVKQHNSHIQIWKYFIKISSMGLNGTITVPQVKTFPQIYKTYFCK